jgi:large subunit ribosomal protein L22
VLKSAIANAEEGDARVEDLFVAESRVDEGPTIKRFQPKDRGRAHPINKRTSHLHIVVDERN